METSGACRISASAISRFSIQTKFFSVTAISTCNRSSDALKKKPTAERSQTFLPRRLRHCLLLVPRSRNNRKLCAGWKRCLRWPIRLKRATRKAKRTSRNSLNPSSPKPSAANSSLKIQTTNPLPFCSNAFEQAEGVPTNTRENLFGNRVECPEKKLHSESRVVSLAD